MINEWIYKNIKTYKIAYAMEARHFKTEETISELSGCWWIAFCIRSNAVGYLWIKIRKKDKEIEIEIWW